MTTLQQIPQDIRIWIDGSLLDESVPIDHSQPVQAHVLSLRDIYEAKPLSEVIAQLTKGWLYVAIHLGYKRYHQVLLPTTTEAYFDDGGGPRLARHVDGMGPQHYDTPRS